MKFKHSDYMIVAGILLSFAGYLWGFGVYAGFGMVAAGWLTRMDEHLMTIVQANKILAGFVLSMDIIAVPNESEES